MSTPCRETRSRDARPFRMFPSVMGGPGACLEVIHSLGSGSRIGAGSCSSSSTCPVPLQSGQSSPSSIQPRPLQRGQTFIAGTFHVVDRDRSCTVCSRILPSVIDGPSGCLEFMGRTDTCVSRFVRPAVPLDEGLHRGAVAHKNQRSAQVRDRC